MQGKNGTPAYSLYIGAMDCSTARQISMLDKDAAPGMRWYSILSASSPGDLENANAGGDGADQNAPLHVFPGVCQVTVVQNKYNTVRDKYRQSYFEDMIVRNII